MKELVFKSEKGNPVTTSLLVAEKFGKNHKEVLRDISNLSCSDDFRQRNFALSSYRSVQNKKLPMYFISRNGFVFLVMGYTGPEAGKLKEDYIDAFDRMEKQLKELNPANLSRLQLLEMALEAEKKAIALKPKADYADRVIDTERKVDIGQAAKLLKLPFGRNTFFKILRERGIFFKNRNEPKQGYIDRGYFEMGMILIERKNHKDISVPKITVTQKGLYWLAKIFGVDFNDSLPVLNAI